MEYTNLQENIKGKLPDIPLSDYDFTDVTVFPFQGENGIAGTIVYPNGKIVFKYSKYNNYTIRHEYKIYQNLNCLQVYCPHFSRSYGLIQKNTDKKTKTANPFNIEPNTYGIKNDILLIEYYNKPKFNQYLLNPNVSEKIIFSTIKQVLLSLSFAQTKIRFTHYDLHSSNIFMDRCKSNLVFLYVIDEFNQFYVAPRGHYPVIFDYGLSYSTGIDNTSMDCVLTHTETGHTSNVFDWVCDAKTFLVSASKTLLISRDSKKAKRFRKLIKRIFSPLPLDFETGWLKSSEKSAADTVVRLFDKFNKKKSELFRARTYECLDIIQSLIILPLAIQDYTDFKLNFNSFLTEWIKIENEFICKPYMLSILKSIVNTAMQVRMLYFEDESRAMSVQKFKEAVYESIASMSKFCRPKNINFELMLGSLLMLSSNIEGLFYEISNKIEKNKSELYSRLMFSSVEQIFACIDVIFQDDFVFKNDTEIIVFDSIKETTQKFNLSIEQTDCINNLSNLVKGTYIYDLYKSSM